MIGWPTSLDFGSVSCGTAPTTTKVFTLTNTGNVMATIVGTAVVGSGYSMDLKVSDQIPPGSPKVVTVTAPTVPARSALGLALTGGLTITTDESTNNVHEISLTEVAEGAVLTWDLPTVADLGTSALGDIVVKNFTIWNGGNQPATITLGSSVTAIFPVAPTGGQVVPVAGLLAATVMFIAPAEPNTYSATVTLTPPSSGVCETPPAPQIVQGISQGPASLSVQGASTHDFGNQAVLSTTANTFTFTFANGVNAQATGVLGVEVVDGKGRAVPDFVVDPNPVNSTCLAVGTLAGGTTCTVALQFTPTSLGPPTKTGTLTVSASPGGSATAPLVGTAISPLTMTASPGTMSADGSSVDLGNTNLLGGGLPVTITVDNEAGAPLTGSLTRGLSGTDAAQFLVQADECTGVHVAPGGKCTVTLLFSPTSIGAKTALINVFGHPGDSAALALHATVIP